MRIIVSILSALCVAPIAYLLLTVANVPQPLLSTVGIVAAALLTSCRYK